MPREGPCRVPGCVAPETASGQWAYLPEAFCNEHGLTLGEACSCKRPACHRVLGKLGPKQAPGRKRKALSPSPSTVASLLEEPLPRPPTIISMIEVWADRCDILPYLCPSLVASLTPLLAVLIRFASRGRCVDIESLGEVERGNVLPQPRSSCSLEYAVHGKWRRTDGDANGVHGCWYVGVDELVEAFGAEVVNAKLAEYEAAQAAARASAVAAAVTAAAARLAEHAT